MIVHKRRYDEQISKRQRPSPEIPVGQQYPEKRTWKIVRDEWIPEKIDYPLQGLIRKQNLNFIKQFLTRLIHLKPSKFYKLGFSGEEKK